MKTVKLLGLTIEGFKSFTTETAITFTPGAGLRFLTGENKITPSLGANGAGKSSVWEALTWCLYNSTSRGRKSSDAVAWGQPGIWVAADLLIDGVECCISRTAPPSKSYIGDRLVDQGEIEELIGLTKAQFCHSVIFAQGARLFYDLDQNARGALLDDMLNLDVWLTASDHAGDAAKACKNDVIALEREQAFIEGKLSALPEEGWLLEQARLLKAQRDAASAAALAEAEALTLDLFPPTDADFAPLIEQAKSELGHARNAITILAREGAVEVANRKTIEKSLTFYAQHTTCEVCKQDLAADFVAGKVAELQADLTLASQRIEKNIEGSRQLSSEIAPLQEQHDALQRQSAEAAFQRRDYEKRKARIDQLLAQAGQEPGPDPFLQQLEARQKTAAELEQALAENLNRIDETRGAMLRFDYWRAAFKRLRLWQTQRMLTMLEVEVEAAALALGMAGWRIAFSTETETKSGSLKSGVHILVSSPQSKGYVADHSGGEEQRIRLAVGIGVANLIQRLTGVYYDFEVWDEPSNWLSTEGIEDLMDYLSNRATATGKAVWVVDHRALGASGFVEVWRAEKEAAGTRLVRIFGEEE
jgi:DNA repair exonuclease SbcCD ATPase subunit